ncbi:unnamed protein product [Lactuca saligna]|uniref:Uncharacterized protein n=1 Tax=Lactuca saligna TaxID=75948 RepID=A0AA35ZBD1_LACSI|nr:unnamed protein product [Lactuca saligna]
MFKGFRGANRTADEFTLADLPCMYPYDWISLLLIMSKDEKTYEPIVAHLKRMLIRYIHESAKMDVEIVYVMKNRPILKPEKEPNNHHKLKLGQIGREHSCVVYQWKECQKVLRSMFFLRDKHLCTT